MPTSMQRRNVTSRRLIAAAMATAASAVLALAPTKASAFDIGGLIGTAMALQMGHYHGGYSSGGHRVTSHHDSNSSDSGSKVERDARDPDPMTPPPPGKSDSRVTVRAQKTQGPSSLSGGIAQASERDGAADQVASAGKAFSDAPAFNPSR